MMDTKMVLREIDSLAQDIQDLGRIILKENEFIKAREEEAKQKARDEGRQLAMVAGPSPVGGYTHWQFITRKFRNLVQAVGAEWPTKELR